MAQGTKYRPKQTIHEGSITVISYGSYQVRKRVEEILKKTRTNFPDLAP